METSIFRELKVTGGRGTEGARLCLYSSMPVAHLTIPRTGMRGVAS